MAGNLFGTTRTRQCGPSASPAHRERPAPRAAFRPRDLHRTGRAIRGSKGGDSMNAPGRCAAVGGHDHPVVENRILPKVRHVRRMKNFKTCLLFHDRSRRRLQIQFDILLRASSPRPVLSHAGIDQLLPLFRLQAEQVAGAAEGLAQRQGAVLLETETIGRRGLRPAGCRSRQSCRPDRPSRGRSAPCRTSGCTSGSIRRARSGWA